LFCLSSRRRHTRLVSDWSSDVCSSDLPMRGVDVLRAAGWPEDICRAVLGHATYSGVPRDTRMAQALFACDELSGFLVACALVTRSEERRVGKEWRAGGAQTQWIVARRG